MAEWIECRLLLQQVAVRGVGAVAVGVTCRRRERQLVTERFESDTWLTVIGRVVVGRVVAAVGVGRVADRLVVRLVVGRVVGVALQQSR